VDCRQQLVQYPVSARGHLGLNARPTKKFGRDTQNPLCTQRLAILDQRFAHINEKYDWDNWSTDFESQVYQALWSNKAVVYGDEGRVSSSQVLSFFRRLRCRIEKKMMAQAPHICGDAEV
jgi:hypothetical protein